MHSISLSLLALHLHYLQKDTTESTEMVTLTKKGCHGINTAAESRGEKLFATVGQADHKNCREECANKKTSHYIWKVQT